MLERTRNVAFAVLLDDTKKIWPGSMTKKMQTVFQNNFQLPLWKNWPAKSKRYHNAATIRFLTEREYQYRRLSGYLIEVYKHMHMYEPIITVQSVQWCSCPSNKHDYRMHEPMKNDLIRAVKNSTFFYQVARICNNNLLSNVVEPCSFHQFKNKLDTKRRSK